MAKQRADLRMDAELLAWSRGFAKVRGVTWTAVIEAAVRGLREDAEGGVPEVESDPLMLASRSPDPGVVEETSEPFYEDAEWVVGGGEGS